MRGARYGLYNHASRIAIFCASKVECSDSKKRILSLSSACCAREIELAFVQNGAFGRVKASSFFSIKRFSLIADDRLTPAARIRLSR